MDNTLQYLTNTEADDYFNNRLQNALWLDSTEARKSIALRQATRIIDKLNFAGDLVDPDQDLQFPRANTSDDNVITSDSTIPDDIKKACCEIAYALLDGIDPDSEIQALTMDVQLIAGARTEYDRTFVPEYIMAGIPSPTAWNYLKPYLRDPRQLNLLRV